MHYTSYNKKQVLTNGQLDYLTFDPLAPESAGEKHHVLGQELRTKGQTRARLIAPYRLLPTNTNTAAAAMGRTFASY
jgi:hypothetical protein